MKTRAITFYGILIAAHLLLLQPCQGGTFFEMALERDSIYTPGKMNLSLKLTDKAKIEGDYKFQLSIYVVDRLLRKQTLPVSKEKAANFELEFSAARNRTEVRCRAALLVNGQFAEAKEKPFIIWPPLEPYSEEPIDKTIWLFDSSGRLQKLFKDLEVEKVDATFQAARYFGVPDIVFIGQDTEPNNMLVITERLLSIDVKPVTIFLKQKQLPDSNSIIIPKENNECKNVSCDMNSPFLQYLTKRDIMDMVDEANYIRIKKQKDRGWSISSSLTEILEDKKSTYSYLFTVEEEDQVTVYCQLPITDFNEPRYAILITNMLKFAESIIDKRKELDNQ